MARFEIVVKDGLQVMTIIAGRTELNPAQDLKDTDLKHIIDSEKLLERLTGYRFHINQVG